MDDEKLIYIQVETLATCFQKEINKRIRKGKHEVLKLMVAELT